MRGSIQQEVPSTVVEGGVTRRIVPHQHIEVGKDVEAFHESKEEGERGEDGGD